MENNNNMNEQRNQLAGEQTENLKNPFWAYALIGFSVVAIIIILGGIFIWKNFSTDEAKEKNKTSYENKEKRNFVSAIIEDKEFEQNTTAEPPKSMIVEANKTTKKKVTPPIITKTGLVVGDAANTGVGVDDSESSRKFRRKIYNIFRRLFRFYRRKSCKIRPRQNYQKRFIINFLNFAVLQKNNLFCQQEFRIFPIEMPCL